MGYKRKARIVFLSGANNLSLMAQGFACSLGGQWMEARAAVLAQAPENGYVAEVMKEAGAVLDVQGGQLLDESLLQWADLMVTLDEEAKASCPQLPSGVQLRHYPFPDPDRGQVTLEACRQIRDLVQARVEGMIGGMRLLQKAAAE